VAWVLLFSSSQNVSSHKNGPRCVERLEETPECSSDSTRSLGRVSPLFSARPESARVNMAGSDGISTGLLVIVARRRKFRGGVPEGKTPS